MNEIIGYGDQVAKIFGLKQGERFKLKPTEYAKVLGYKPLYEIYVFSADQLMSVGQYDGWSDLYGWNANVLERMILGLYTVKKIHE
jgi:hypothetical protein